MAICFETCRNTSKSTVPPPPLSTETNFNSLEDQSVRVGFELSVCLITFITIIYHSFRKVLEGPVINYGQGWHHKEIGWVDKISHKIKVRQEKNYEMKRLGEIFFSFQFVFNNFLITKVRHQVYQ